MQRYYYCFSVYAQRSPLRVRGVCPKKGGFALQKQKGERQKNFPRARAIALFVFVILATRRFILSLSVCVSFCVYGVNLVDVKCINSEYSPFFVLSHTL